ncbi:TRAP transporter substrate-binding protein [Halocella sp. SP3-1]|uniref:TRAP transporter substrate-binding protein n=1 Tax=Halocella sp. SP3-1 TaxID=2382161 RepID=UPI000F74C8CC|nr:TRAP transporter substrate-binding protein [Halocella sp. SP3-1]AZO93654.1 TRAP transporter substrate-binding protein [Halocella sp. SP3-1]
MRKLLTVFTVVMIITICLSVVVNASEIIMQHNVSKNHPWHKGLLYLSQRIEELSNGEMKAKIYPNGVLAQNNWKIILEQTQRNVCQIMVESTIPFATLQEELFALNTPFLFDDWQHFIRFMDSNPTVVNKWFKKLEDKDVMVIAAWPRPPRQELNAVKSIKKPEDIKGLKFRVPGLNIFVKTFKALGAKPVPLQPSEIYTAMQLGTIAGADNSIGCLYDFKTHEVSKYLTKWDYMMDTAVVVVSKSWYENLTSKERDILKQAAIEASDIVYKEASKLQDKAIHEMKDMGIEVTYFTPEMKQPFKEKMSSIYKMLEKTVGAENWEKFLNAVEETR